MTISTDQAIARRRALPVAITVGLHIVLLLLWRYSTLQQRPAASPDKAPAIAWIEALKKPKPLPLPPPVHTKPTTVPASPSARLAPAAPPPLAELPAPVPVPVAPPAPSAPAEGIMQRALRDVGKIDKDLRAHSPGGRFSDAPATPNAKLVAGIEKATRAPKLWEAPRIENVQDQGGYDRRIYKVKTALGEYCIYKESNHAPDGLDVFKRGVGEKLMSCPREE
jgi:hypothetical protein